MKMRLVGQSKDVVEIDGKFYGRDAIQQAFAMLQHLISLDSDDFDNLESLKGSARELITGPEGK